MKSAIETDLQKITSVTPQRGEARQQYLSRMMNAVHGLTERQWEKLRLPIQTWYNDAAAANDQDHELPDFPDDDGTIGVEGDGETTAPPPPKAKANGTTAAKKATAAKPTPPRPTKPATQKTGNVGLQVRIKKYLMEHGLDATADDIVKSLGGEKNCSALTVSAIRSEFRSSVKLLAELGWLNREVPL